MNPKIKQQIKMKRTGNLILQIADFVNIRVAYWKSTKAETL